jgi:hypothetical protein
MADGGPPAVDPPGVFCIVAKSRGRGGGTSRAMAFAAVMARVHEETRVLRSSTMQRSTPESARNLRHRTEPRPLHFPEEALVPESVEHLNIREFLHLLLRFVLGDRAFVGSDQFVYFDGSNPRRCVAPDVYLKWGGATPPITSWKTWERGTPELCIEIEGRAYETAWEERLAHYRSLGVRELMRFDPYAAEGSRLRVWDRIDDDLVERAVEHDATPCASLGFHWVVRSIADAPVAPRLAYDPAGERLVLTEAETLRAEAAAHRADAEAAAKRIAELEAELRRRGD